MDIIDSANEHADRELELRIEAFKKERLNAPMISLEFCIDCEEPIPELRQKAVIGCQRCVDCQEIDDIKRQRRR